MAMAKAGNSRKRTSQDESSQPRKIRKVQIEQNSAPDSSKSQRRGPTMKQKPLPKSSTSVHLPDEIIDHIFQELAADNDYTFEELWSAMRTCRSWYRIGFPLKQRFDVAISNVAKNVSKFIDVNNRQDMVSSLPSAMWLSPDVIKSENLLPRVQNLTLDVDASNLRGLLRAFSDVPRRGLSVMHLSLLVQQSTISSARDNISLFDFVDTMIRRTGDPPNIELTIGPKVSCVFVASLAKMVGRNIRDTTQVFSLSWKTDASKAVKFKDACARHRETWNPCDCTVDEVQWNARVGIRKEGTSTAVQMVPTSKDTWGFSFITQNEIALTPKKSQTQVRYNYFGTVHLPGFWKGRVAMERTCGGGWSNFHTSGPPLKVPDAAKAKPAGQELGRLVEWRWAGGIRVPPLKSAWRVKRYLEDLARETSLAPKPKAGQKGGK